MVRAATLQPWARFFDNFHDAVLLLDARGRVVSANLAALRLAPCELGQPLAQWRGVLGDAALQWLQQAVQQPPAVGGAAPDAWAADGSRRTLAFETIGAELRALHLQATAAGPEAAPPPGVAAVAPRLGAAALGERVRAFWESPFPALLQDADFRVLDANAAFCEFTGHPRDALLGRELVQLLPEGDRAAASALRRRPAHPTQLRTERRLIDASGRERWFREAPSTLADDTGHTLHLSVLQDVTAEHAAHERAERSARELDDWFDLSPVGMLLFDAAGMLLRSNPAFVALVGPLPETLGHASPALRQLLACSDAGPSPELQPGRVPLRVEGWLPQADGPARRLAAIVRCYLTSGGQARYMAVLEDRSAEDERDLAQTQLDALVDTAGLGLATFQESSGWVRQRQPLPGARGGEAAPPSAAALQSISRDIVLPQSLPEYEKLQHALRHAQRAEVRYAIRHASLGERWLLTRVEPATLASGKRTTSVVTIDVTEQELSQQRSEQLLRELTTILDSSSAGIAYLREHRLVRCNRPFEAMLGLPTHADAGTPFDELFVRAEGAARIGQEVLAALAQGQVYETEFSLPAVAAASGERGAATTWLALSVRRSAPSGEQAQVEAIVVLSDVTRLKLQQTELEVLARDRELMFSLSEVGIAFLRDGVLQRANSALARLADMPAAELAGLPLAELFPDVAPGSPDAEREEDALRNYGRWVGERKLRRRNGKVLWVQISQRLVQAGQPALGIIASYVNVDARHRAEQAVAVQAERTRAILDSVLVGIVTVGPNGIEWMNRSARRMFGGDLADFIGQPIGTVATPEPGHPFRRTQYLDELIEGQAETFECRVKARDGREFWVVGNAVMTGRENTGRQLTYALLDIERRRQAEARIADAQASLQRIIEAAPMAIILLEAASLRVLQVNEVASSSFGRLPHQVVGCTPEDMFTPSVAGQLRVDMAQALATLSVTQREYRYQQDGQAYVWDARYLPLASADSAPDQLLLVATDVSEQRAAQQAKFEAEIAQRDMLVKEVHHRIKNNLQGVAGLLQQIAARKPEMAQAMAEVVGQVQAIAQVYGLQVGAAGPLRAKNVAEAIAASVQRTFGTPIVFSVEGPSPHQWAFPEAESIPIALTLNELLTNAVKHSTPGPAHDVRCRLVCSDGGVAVVISNAGRLPAGFNLAGVPGGVSGLGLVRALLPRRSAVLLIEQQGDLVVTTVTLVPPGVSRLTQV